MVKGIISKLDCSLKTYIEEFILMMDELLSIYSKDKWVVFTNVGIEEEEFNKLNFGHYHFINALDFYLKEKNGGLSK